MTVTTCSVLLIIFAAASLRILSTLEMHQQQQQQQERQTRAAALTTTRMPMKKRMKKGALRNSGERLSSCLEGLHDMIQLKETHWTAKRPLPLFRSAEDSKEKGGGVIIFWHLAKTGGTTVRKQCATLPGVDYMMLVTPQDYEGGAQTIADRLTPLSVANTGGTSENEIYRTETENVDQHNHSRSHTLFVELHGMNSPTVLGMEPHLQQWRQLSEQHGTPLFIFTILREPVSYSISFFNFFHQHVTEQPSEYDLMRNSFNRQCHTLAAPPGQSRTACAQLYHKFYQYFDWVGTTESLTTETLPLLQHLFRHKESQTRFATNATSSWLLPSSNDQNNYNVATKNKFAFRRDFLSTDTILKIHEHTCLDRGLWERAQLDFSLDMWEDNIAVVGRR